MRGLAVAPPDLLERHGAVPQRADVQGTEVWCGQVASPLPAFDPAVAAHARHALVHVRAFSCNYRDRYLLFKALADLPGGRPYALGSEFAGEVVAVGSEVARVQPGDRVMADNLWPYEEQAGWRPGVPTNHASWEFLVVHEEHLARLPPKMGYVEAAAFSVGGQTAYSMVGKLGVAEGGHVLVTAGTSNTSLFSVAALRAQGVQAYVTTTSDRFTEALLGLGATAVFRVDPAAESWLGHREMIAVTSRLRGFDGVVDPFSDTHLAKVLPFLKQGGRYVTCGMSDAELGTGGAGLRTGLAVAILRNLQIIGNCSGQRSHLEHAVRDYERGLLPVRVDRVFHGDAAAAFLERTFTARDRLGKVVFAYDAAAAAGHGDGT
jgi:NADPH:quinone reductase-like Zn-dependent oxidoreductase